MSAFSLFQDSKIPEQAVRGIIFPGSFIANAFHSGHRLLNEGGFGKVYAIELPNLGKVAIKVSISRESSILMDEYHACTLAQHPKVIETLGIAHVAELGLCIVFGYADRGDLQQPATQGMIVKQHILEALGDIAEALDHLHASGIVHGDVKPSNFLVQSSSSNPRSWVCRLGDFGLASILCLGSYSRGAGTKGFMAPEILQGGGAGQC